MDRPISPVDIVQDYFPEGKFHYHNLRHHVPGNSPCDQPIMVDKGFGLEDDFAP